MTDTELQDLPRAVDVVPPDMRSAVRDSPLAEDLTGLRVDSDDEDDPVLLRPDGTVVDTWREDYPYGDRMSRAEYDSDKRLRFTEHLNPRGAQVVALEKPSERERTQWYFQRYVSHLPAAGEIVLFDRSWYNRAGVERVMGFCTAREYLEFMRQAPDFERMLVRSEVSLVKFWFSVSRSEQRTRFAVRQIDPVRQWKLSPMDLASLDRWDAYTEAKEAMFFYTDTADAPWTVVKSNDKKRARLAAMRHVLASFDYDGKDSQVVGTPDPLIIGRGKDLFEQGEHTGEVFPTL
jgi:polyphosphate kinase 2